MKISYNWLKSYVSDLPEVDKLWGIFTYHLCEVESMDVLNGDTIFDINILPNRAHDLLSHQGIARELAGQLGLKFNDPTSLYKIPESKETKLQIESQTENCRRYSGRIVRNIKVEPSPEWVVKHLESVGQRSINNIVDATNIVMYDCGQPCHAFDLRKIPNEKVLIKNAKDAEELELLGSEKLKVKLKDTDVVIVNDNDVTLGIAGVKGGLHSGVQDDTTEIVLEVANFDPVAVRKTARRIGILTDSAKRFENDLSPSLCDFAMKELTALILEMCPDAQFEDVVNFEKTKSEEKRKISFDVNQINNMLGAKISHKEIAEIFQKYGFKYEQNGDLFILEIPEIRLDLISLNDVAEEIGRIIGYDKLEPVLPKINFAPKKNETYEKISATREKLISAGYSEVMTYAFCKSGVVEVAYGTGGEEFLRTNLSDGIKKSFELNRLNAPLLGIDKIKIFEIGNVFPKKDLEEIHVAIADAKSVKEFKLDDAEKELENIKGAEIFSAEKISAQKNINANKKFVMWSQFPFITRDIAVWVPEGTDENILINVFKDFGGELLVGEPRLFDRFTKENKTSLAFHLLFQSQTRTLKDDEANTIVDNIYNTLKNKGFIPR